MRVAPWVRWPGQAYCESVYAWMRGVDGRLREGENADLMGGNDGECNLASMGNLALARLDGSVICVLMWP